VEKIDDALKRKELEKNEPEWIVVLKKLQKEIVKEKNARKR